LCVDQSSKAAAERKDFATSPPPNAASQTGRQYEKPWLSHSKKTTAKEKETSGTFSGLKLGRSKLPGQASSAFRKFTKICLRNAKVSWLLNCTTNPEGSHI